MTNDKYQALLLIGPPGSGKGTIGKKLAMVTDQVHLSSGDIFRGIDRDSEVGKLQRKYADQGLLVPDETTVEICLNYIQGLIFTNRFRPSKQKIILDGIPRTLKQAQIFGETVEFKKILVLDVPNRQVLFDRLRKRAAIEGRADDMDDKILEKRFDVYKEQTEVVLSQFPKEAQIHINADQSPYNVFKDVLVKLSDFF